MVAGPRFGAWLASRLALSAALAAVWPVLHWSIAISFTVLAIELLYFLAPKVERFSATLPGGAPFRYPLEWSYFPARNLFPPLREFNRTYGTLGGLIAFMTWLYWTTFVLLVGADATPNLPRRARRDPYRRKKSSPQNGREPNGRPISGEAA